jgi:mRNA interferase MazF
MAATYEPDRGDIVWLDFNPQTGHEQAGRRPAVVLSPKTYNQKTGLAIFCPITSKVKAYPFIVALPDNLKVKGVVLSDQVKSFDWKSRNAKFICRLPDERIEEVKQKLSVLLE